MSIEAKSAVYKFSRSKGSERLVMLILADYAWDDGTNCYPSVPTIARKANLSDRAVQQIVQRLVVLGELRVEEKVSPVGTNMFTFTIPGWDPRPDPVESTRVVKSLHQGGEKISPLKAEGGEKISPGVVKSFHQGGEGCFTRVVKAASPDPLDNKKNKNTIFPEKIVATESDPQTGAAPEAISLPTDQPATKPKRGRKPKAADEENPANEKFPVAGWRHTVELVRWACEQNPGLDWKREIARFRAYWEGKDKWTTERGWVACYKNWMLSPYEKAILPKEAATPPAAQVAPKLTHEEVLAKIAPDLRARYTPEIVARFSPEVLARFLPEALAESCDPTFISMKRRHGIPLTPGERATLQAVI